MNGLWIAQCTMREVLAMSTTVCRIDTHFFCVSTSSRIGGLAEVAKNSMSLSLVRLMTGLSDALPVLRIGASNDGPGTTRAGKPMAESVP